MRHTEGEEHTGRRRREVDKKRERKKDSALEWGLGNEERGPKDGSSGRGYVRKEENGLGGRGRLAGEREASRTHWRKKNTEEGAKKRKGPRDGGREAREGNKREREREVFLVCTKFRDSPKGLSGKVSEWGMKGNGRKQRRKGKRNHNVAPQNGTASCHQHPKRRSGERGP